MEMFSIYLLICYRKKILPLLHKRCSNRPKMLSQTFSSHTHKKTWSQSCHSFHGLRLSHCPTCRNEQRWKPHADVYTNTPCNMVLWNHNAMTTYVYIPKGVPVALFLTSNCEFARFQSVKTKALRYAFYVYVSSLRYSPRGLSACLKTLQKY